MAQATGGGLQRDAGSASEYNARVDELRPREYPMLKDTIYLDHAGTTLYAKSLIDRFSSDMLSSLYGNPHSFSTASLNASRCTDQIRSRILNLFHASHDDFDLVFTANATAGMKLVMDAFRETGNGFWYGYHRDAHTSLIGVRETARAYKCFESDQEVWSWITEDCCATTGQHSVRLFAYPAQSNLDGRRLPLEFISAIRQQANSDRATSGVYTLLDAAALVSTCPLDLSIAAEAPDFTVLSLYKIFGFPDLGALIVRKPAAVILQSRKYFGGGTVDLVTNLNFGKSQHIRKNQSIHEQLEDGTLPIHSIVAVGQALDVHKELFGSLDRISKHCAYLADRLHADLAALRHGNGLPVCELYGPHKGEGTSTYLSGKQGPIVAFNIKDSQGQWVSNAEVEKLAAIRDICLRTGGLCNPGGSATALGLGEDDLLMNYKAGKRCDGQNDIIRGRPTGMIRVSLGAMSTMSDVDAFRQFMQEYFVQSHETDADQSNSALTSVDDDLVVESISVYPIKSCAGFQIPVHTAWPVFPEGLAWDREWCLVHAGTGVALSQKRHPRMALIRPVINVKENLLHVSLADGATNLQPIIIPLSAQRDQRSCKVRSAKVCGDTVDAQSYGGQHISDFFSQALGVSCYLAHLPRGGGDDASRHTKAVLQPFQRTDVENDQLSDTDSEASSSSGAGPILLSNESPVLIVSQSSVDAVNRSILSAGGEAVDASVFRANIVVARKELDGQRESKQDSAFAEDYWRLVMIGNQMFQMLGSCQRCQMICVDQRTAARNSEPFLALAKTRRFNGKVWFGQHACHLPTCSTGDAEATPTIRIGDLVRPCNGDKMSIVVT